MDFNQKLQHLRNQKGMTQEELAEKLFVSRTAISKWESGRGYPNIESLKAIAKFFSITIDELLSGDEVLSLAEEDNKKNKKYIYDIVFGMIDICTIMLLFLPFFRQKNGEFFDAVSLLSLNGVQGYLKVGYYVVTFISICMGLLMFILQNSTNIFWVKNNYKISSFLSLFITIVFIVSMQPYAAVFTLMFLIIKSFIVFKLR